MTELVLVLSAFLVSFLTLFTGFGLGTLLLPVFALFVPVQIAVASTAIVHGANNLFKASLLYRDIDRSILFRFGGPAVISAFAGAYVLSTLTSQGSLHTWEVFGRTATITPVGLVMSLLILAFAAFELMPALHSFRMPPRFIPLGGVLSGFFGGLSGHQGALRAAFLGPLGLVPAAFAATQAVLGLIVDIARLIVYSATFLSIGSAMDTSALPGTLILLAIAAAFFGALLGKRVLPNVTIGLVRKTAGALLVVVGLALGTGLTGSARTSAQEKDGTPMTTDSADRKIDYIEFNSPDMASVKSFYAEAFGWTFQDWGEDYVSFEDGRIAGGFRKGDVVKGTTLVILFATDLEAAKRAVMKAGGTITVDIFSFPGGRRFHFADPAGNLLAVWSDNEPKEN